MLVPRVVTLIILAACGAEPVEVVGEDEMSRRLFAIADTGGGDADTDSDTDSDTDGDSDADTTPTTETGFSGPCVDCSTAAELADDPGGSPCSTGGLAPMGTIWAPALLLLARRRRAGSDRSPSRR